VDSRPEQDDLPVLLRRVAYRDRAAFLQLYRRVAAKLYGVALRILGRRELADEAVQEAFLRIWQNAASFDPQQASPIAWMAAIARHQAIDLKRRRAERISAASVDLDDVGVELKAGGYRSDLPDVRGRLRECLERLPAERRSMVVEAYCAGLTREELSQRFARPVNTIKTQLRRSLADLKRCLDGET
jgi:RNA polymerase sigma-70 factor (ECF subfamily)